MESRFAAAGNKCKKTTDQSPKTCNRKIPISAKNPTQSNDSEFFTGDALARSLRRQPPHPAFAAWIGAAFEAAWCDADGVQA